MSAMLATPHEVAAQTEAKILSFRELPVGWHFGGGAPPSQETIDSALRLNREAMLLGFEKTNAFPGIEGEIQVTAYLDTFSFEFTIERDGAITFVKEQADRELVYEQGLTLDEAINRLRAAGERNGIPPNHSPEALRP